MHEFTDEALAAHDAEVREQILDALRPEYSDLIPTIQARSFEVCNPAGP